MPGIGLQHSKQWQPNDPVRATRLEDFNSEISDIRSVGHDRGLVRESKGVQLNACDATTNWAASGVATALAIDTDKKLEGTGSLKIGASGAGTATYTYTPAPQNYSTKKKLLLDLWFDYVTYGSITSVTVKIGSDSSNYKYSAITINADDYGDWKKRVELVISSMSTTGAPNMAAVDYFAIDIVVTGAIEAGRILIDDIRVADLAVDIAAFTANVGGTIINVSEVSELDLTDSATNYIEVSTAGTVSVNTSAFTADQANLAIVVTSGGAISSISVKRADVVGGQFSSGGTPIMINEVDNETTARVINRLLHTTNTNIKIIGFPNGRTASCWFQFQLPDTYSASTDIIFDLTLISTIGGGNLRMQLDYWIVADGGDTTPTTNPTGTTNETIAAPAAVETLKKVTTSTLKVPGVDLSAGALVICKLSRLGADGADTATGEMQLATLQAYQ